MIKFILFDVDGVLLNGQSFSATLEQNYGITQTAVQPFFDDAFPKAILGSHDMKQLLEPFLKEWKWPGTVEDFVSFWFKSDSVINEPLLDYIMALTASGTACYLATNQEKYRTAYLLDSLGFGDIFDGSFVSSQMGVKKPDAAFFEKVIAQLAPQDPAEILFWDDRLENVTAAKAVGIQAEMYSEFAVFDTKMQELLG